MKKLKLLRNKQCAKCPWKKSTNPYDIPHGYDLEYHRDLIGTIATGSAIEQIEKAKKDGIRCMACHELAIGNESHCIGWLMNQLGPGNNIPLRLEMRKYDLSKIELDGEQHETFEDTLPKG